MSNMIAPEEDFSKRRIKPASALVGLGIVALGVGLYFAARRSSEVHKDAATIQAEVHKILLEPVEAQEKAWRKVLDAKDSDERMKQEAIFQLARLRDPESADRFVKMLADATDEATIRVLAMALLEYPVDKVAGAKGALEKDFDKRTTANEPQITAALVYIRDKDYFAKIVDVYKKDVMNSAKRVDGSAAFDPTDLAKLTDRATFRALAKDPNPGVRQLVAVVLSDKPEKEDLDTLVALLNDKEIEVSSAASVGIALLNDPSATKVLIEKLEAAEKTDNEQARMRYIDALRNGIGGAGLTYALKVVPQTPDMESRGRYIMTELRELADPQAAQAYKEYLADKTNPPHYRSQIALALADIGDPDAVPYLAERLDEKGIGWQCTPPAKDCLCNNKLPASDACLSSNLGWTRQAPVDADPVTFREHQFAAQDIGDLALLYPDKKEAFLQVSGDHLKKFNSWFPSPWLQPVRALAYMGDKETLDWSKKFSKEFKLPPEDQVNPSTELSMRENTFATATRYVGYAGDDAMIDTLTKYLKRPKTAKGDEIYLEQSEMEIAKNPTFREALLFTAQAATDGLAEWGPKAGKATKAILELIQDKHHGIFPRLMAGRTLGMIASPQDLADALKQAKGWADSDARVAVLMGVQHRATPEMSAAAMELIAPATDGSTLAVDRWAARVIGWGGTKGLEDKLLKMMDDDATRPFAVLAIVLGGDEDLVRRGLATFDEKARAKNKWEAELQTIRADYLDSFESRPLTPDDVDSGRLYRFVRNAEIMRRLGSSDSGGLTGTGGSSHDWAAGHLATGLRHLDMNATVPGGMDRLMLRVKLIKAAKTGDDATKTGAIQVLEFLKEQGVVMSLRNEAGATGELARRAFFELRNPEVGLPEGKKQDEKKGQEYFSKPTK